MTDAPKTAEIPDGAISPVTVDIDSYVPNWQLEAIRAAHNARDAGAVHVEVIISSSGFGIHLICWFDEWLSDTQKTRLRETLGDDPNRLHMDELRGRHHHTRQVLWTQKGDNEVDDDFSSIWDALEAIEMSRPDADVPRRFANDGRKAVGNLAFPTRTPPQQ